MAPAFSCLSSNLPTSKLPITATCYQPDGSANRTWNELGSGMGS